MPALATAARISVLPWLMPGLPRVWLLHRTLTRQATTTDDGTVAARRGSAETEPVMLSKPPLLGRRVALRALGPAYAEAMFDSIQDPEAARLTGSHGTFGREMIAAHCERVAAADDRLDDVIALRDDPTYRGEVVLRYIDPDNRCVSYRINLAAWAPRGAGLGGETSVLLLRHGFDVWPLLHRVELEVYDFNSRAIRACEKLGFVREGLKRDSLWWEGRVCGAVQMTLLRPEFDALHGDAAG